MISEKPPQGKPRSTSFRTEIVNGKRQIQCHSISLIHFQKGDLRSDDSSETAATRQSEKTISLPTEFQPLSLKGHLRSDDSSVNDRPPPPNRARNR
uniref:Ovule protein n=1 Tax=Caenorhabditis tropicalis TaxID=1561998 RepID=A0A1I7TTV6_9PELO